CRPMAELRAVHRERGNSVPAARHVLPPYSALCTPYSLTPSLAAPSGNTTLGFASRLNKSAPAILQLRSSILPTAPSFPATQITRFIFLRTSVFFGAEKDWDYLKNPRNRQSFPRISRIPTTARVLTSCCILQHSVGDAPCVAVPSER